VAFSHTRLSNNRSLDYFLKTVFSYSINPNYLLAISKATLSFKTFGSLKNEAVKQYRRLNGSKI